MREVLVCSYPLTVLSEIVRAQGTLSRKTVTRDHGKTLKWITFSAMFVAARKPARPQAWRLNLQSNAAGNFD